MKKSAIPLLTSLTILILISIAVVYFFKLPITTKPALSLETATRLTPVTLPSFSLQDSKGQIFDNNALLGRWTILFFGYANCPDVCPSTLTVLKNVWQALSATTTLSHLRFVFVTLDPIQDTLPKLNTFLANFHSDFLGVSGNTEALLQLQKTFNVHVETVNDKEQTRLAHTATLFVINPQGRFEVIFSPPFDAWTIANDLRTIVGN